MELLLSGSLISSISSLTHKINTLGPLINWHLSLTGRIWWFNMTEMNEQLASSCFWLSGLQTILPTTMLWKKENPTAAKYSPYSVTAPQNVVFFLLNKHLCDYKKGERSQKARYFLEGCCAPRYTNNAARTSTSWRPIHLRVKIPSLFAFCFLFLKVIGW